MPGRRFPTFSNVLAVAAVLAGTAHAAGPTTPPPLYRPSAQKPAAVANWLSRYTSMAPDQVVSVGDEFIVAVVSRQPVDSAHPGVLRLEIRAELTDPDSENAKLMRSLSASLEVNCPEHSSRILEVRTFAGANLTGAQQVSRPNEGWVADPAGSYFEDIDNAICTPGATRPLGPARLAAASPTEAQTVATQRTSARPVPGPAAEKPPPVLRPALSADDPLPKSAATPAATARTPKPPLAPPRASGSAQIAAGASQAQAEAALSQLRAAQPSLMNGLSTRIERIERNGVAYYRALVFGFAPPADAANFCRRLSAAGHACIVR
jgi:hypothetical protein